MEGAVYKIMYNIDMSIKEVSFSEARQKLSSIVDQVEKSGPPVKILRHGKVVAVVVNAEEYKLKSVRSKPFKLAGSIKLRKGVDFEDRKSTRLNSSHGYISYAVFCLKKKNQHVRDMFLNIVALKSFLYAIAAC